MSQSTLPPTPYSNSNLFSGYYLDERVADLDEWDCDDEAIEAFEELRDLYDEERELLSTYNEDMLVDAWIDEVLDVLGFDKVSETTLPGGGGYVDGLLFGSTDDRRTAVSAKQSGNTDGMYERAGALLEAKQWDAEFEAQFHEGRNYRDASHQIKYYLERTPEGASWGILTNGRKWRLYGTKDYQTQTYYEVDLPELIESESLETFKYFYVFFRAGAFRESAGTTFLDEVWSESETAAQELGEDLQDNVFTALRVLGRGFVETNDLGIDPADEAARAELKEQSLVLLYRLMFIMYAESRDLINPDDSDARDEYAENFSLDTVRQDVLDTRESGETFDEAYSEFSTGLWSRLENLFELIDEGEPKLDIPPYNGGLFDAAEHGFLAENEVSDRYLAEVVYRLSTTKGDDGGYVLADYADLDTRHLGTIYEGLLEHEFRIAPEQYAAVAEDGGQVWKPATEVSVADAVETVDGGGLYVVNDDGERKATGAYYTPDYVVTYIVEETVGPLVDDIEADLRADGLEPGEMEYFRRLWQSVKELRILDPAMGSGHFLTKATAYLTERVMSVVRELELQTFNEQEIRRGISKECIYGVDLNGMAVELAKLSMWLETLAADQPLAFLDHHLKDGNSLIGSDIEEIEELESGAADADGQQSSLTEFGFHRRGTIEHLMEVYQEFLAIENENIEDVREMKRKYREIEQDELRQRLVAMANVHTAERFDLDVPSGAYERMAESLDDDESWAAVAEKDWFVTAQTLAADHDFLHWKLEFPEVFYGADGDAREDGGFDAVVGNPPWLDIKGIEDAEILFEMFETSFNRTNIYCAFVERISDLISTEGKFGYITPNSYMTQSSYKPLRKHLLSQYQIENLVRLPDNVFPEVTMESAIITAHTISESPNGYINIVIYSRDFDISEIPEGATEGKVMNQKNWRTDDYIIDIFTSEEEVSVLKSIESVNSSIKEYFDTCLGITPYDKHQGHSKKQIDNRVFHSSEKESDSHYKITTGEGIQRYVVESEGGEWIKYGEWLGAPREEKFFSEPRCIVRQIVSTSGPRGIYAGYSEKKLFHTQVGFVLLAQERRSNLAKTVTGILNSKLMTFYHRKQYLDENKDTFQKILIQDARRFPLPKSIPNSHLENEVDSMRRVKKKRKELSVELKQYLSSEPAGPSLNQIGLYQPPDNAGTNILAGTSEDYDSLRIGESRVTRTGDNTVAIEATARYKPENDGDHETDRWGYTETEFLEAFRITDLTEREIDLVREFVPVAVDEAGGFAEFRETATKTNSLIDRLKALTLPDPEAVADELDAYLEATERAEELDEKIRETDDRIDEIVYELYGLTDEEIEIVEDAVAED